MNGGPEQWALYLYVAGRPALPAAGWDGSPESASAQLRELADAVSARTARAADADTELLCAARDLVRAAHRVGLVLGGSPQATNRERHASDLVQALMPVTTAATALCTVLEQRLDITDHVAVEPVVVWWKNDRPHTTVRRHQPDLGASTEMVQGVHVPGASEKM